jgi:hypothetical protein
MLPAQSEVQIDTAEVRVTQWRLAPGSATDHHIHEMDYVIVPVTTGEMTIVAPNGERSKAQLGAGISYFRKAGVEHDVLNESATDKVPASVRGWEWSAMLNYVKKFALEILPSVAATVIGAYIVNHYISAKPADAPLAAAVSPADVKKNGPKPADGSTSSVASIPEHGVTAKGISERGMMEKSASERPGEFKPAEAKSPEAKSPEAKSPEAKPSEAKPAEAKQSDSKPTETAAKHPTPPAPPKAVAKTTPAPSASPTAPVETASVPADRDANDLARAAIERLRKEDGQSHSQEASRAPETPHLQEAPRAVAPPTPPVSTASIRPLPPPITVIVPPVEGQANNQGFGQGNPPPYTASINPDDSNRLVPPADIPPPPPIDLRAGADKLATRTNNMAHDVLAKTKSMFHALLPGSNGDNGDRQSSSASQFTD